MSRLFWNVFMVLLTLVALILLWQFRIALLLFLLSLVVASAVRPTITALINRGLSLRSALAAAYSLLVIGIIGLVLLAGGPLVRDVRTFADDFVTGYERAKMEWPRGGTLFQRTIVEQLPPADEVFAAVSSDGGAASALGVIGAAQDVFTTLGQFAIVIVLSVYWSADQQRFERLSLSLIPRDHHKTARRAWLAVTTGVGPFVRGELLQSILAGLLLGGMYAILGVRYAALYALWVAVARLIPWFGALLAILLPFLALIGGSPLLGVVTGFFTILLLLAIKTVIEPRFFERSRYNSLLIVLFIIAMTELFGVAGGLLAPTAAVASQLVYEQVFPKRLPLTRLQARSRMDALLQRITELESQIQTEGVKMPTETFQEVEKMRSFTAKFLEQQHE